MLRSRWPSLRRRRLLVAISLLAAGATQPAARSLEQPPGPAAIGRSKSIIVLRPGARPDEVASRHGLRVGEQYTAVFNGFGAAGNTAAPDLTTDPDIEAVIPNQSFRLDAGLDGPLAGGPAAGGPAVGGPAVGGPAADGLAAGTQTIPLSRARVGLLASPFAAIDGTGPGVDADIAVIDTGIDPAHPDLNVAGGHNCTSADRAAWQDEDGHGTAVAGVAAMEDNHTGYVGVAPGARLWAVRIFDGDGRATLEGILCAVEWISEHADVIDVANMSFSSFGQQDGACGHVDQDLFHTAVCRATDRGVVFVAAAGNDAMDAAGIRPASFPEVIAVSALTDTDGLPGGLGAPGPCGSGEADDTMATWSNHGPSVDIAAPGVCVDSSLPAFDCDGLIDCYGVLSGTSLSAPFVTGAVALLGAAHPDWLPTEVRSFLLTGAEAGSLPEGVLSVAGW